MNNSTNKQREANSKAIKQLFNEINQKIEQRKQNETKRLKQLEANTG
jgi:hypothetical protein